MPTPEDVIAAYRQRIARFAAERDRAATKSRRIGVARVLAFTAAFALLLRAELAAPGRAAFLAAGAALLVAFFGLVLYHGRVRRELRRRELRVRVNEEGPLRIARDWDALPGADVPPPAPEHPYAADLDIFGRASLFQLLGTAGTATGRATLRDWLLAPAAPAEVRARQEAAAELAPMNDLRDELAVRARERPPVPPEDVDRFLEWAEAEPWLSRRPALVWTSRLLPVATVALAAADMTGLIGPPLWLLSILAGLLATRAAQRRAHETFGRAFAHEGAFRAHAELVRLIAAAPFRAPRLHAVQAALHVDGEPAHRRMRRLERLMELADLRHNGMFHFPIHALTLWDFHVLYALEGWQRENGRRARAWIAGIGEVEALAALATLAHDHPDWCFPEIREAGPPALEARALGHPLLPPAVRVDNDVTVGPPGTVLFVTGSNMSGKSTLLRAIGTNAVLALAGGPACAAAMALPPVRVWSAMRVQDSLSRGVSYFMAELQRLKQIVDAARDDEGADERGAVGAASPAATTSPETDPLDGPSAERPTVLYLLDEILHGTNTAERRVAAERVIAFLVRCGAIGAVSTHDLALADAPLLRDALRPVHFTEEVRRENGRMAMRFDYQLRPGVATSTNALALMELVGLGLGESAPGPPPDPEA